MKLNGCYCFGGGRGGDETSNKSKISPPLGFFSGYLGFEGSISRSSILISSFFFGWTDCWVLAWEEGFETCEYLTYCSLITSEASSVKMKGSGFLFLCKSLYLLYV